MPIKNDFPENYNRGGDAAGKGQPDKFAQTDTKYTKTQYTTQANADDVTVRGIVVDENAHALNNCAVEFWDQWRGRRLYATSTADNGEWFLRMPAGQYYAAFYKDDLYDEIGYMTIISPTDSVQEFDTVQLGFNPPEFRITPVQKYYIKLMRSFLGDTNPNAYIIDSEHKFLYSDDDLVMAAHMALNDVNGAPAKSHFALHELPEHWRSLIVWGGSAQSMFSRGLFENQNQIQYSEGGLSLTIQRAAHLLSTAQTVQDRYEKTRDKFKLSYRPGPHVMVRSMAFKVRCLAPRQFRMR